MDNPKNDAYFVKKIITDLQFICEHMDGQKIEDFSRNEILSDSMHFRLIQLYENARKLSDKYKADNPSIPWSDIAGLRNRIVHDYGNVDMHIVFETLTVDIPKLLKLFQNA